MLSIFKYNVQEHNVPLMLHNTLSGTKEVFVPLKDRHVRMYNCGPTVYDIQTVGNLRSYVFADVLRRTFEYNGYEVTQVVNITDVGHLTSDADTGEDKLEKAAVKTGKGAADIAREVTRVFFDDLRRVGVDTGKITFPRATEHIAEQVALIRTLEEKGYTYKTRDGIYFDTSCFKEYGKLGGIDLSGLKEGARVTMKEKKNPTDFALWKFSSPKEKRQQEWDSPWGIGFPGWHVECSAMSMKYLGKTFDVHTGGIDHIPIHHNNEIAQSEAATGRPFVRYWLHNAFITINNEKIAKSVGNTVYVSDIVSRGLSPLAYRYWLLTAHYRSSANFTWDALSGAHTALLRLYRHVADFEISGRPTSIKGTSSDVNREYQKRFHLLVNDDLDTPKALALLWDIIKDDSVSSKDKHATLLDFDRVLGLGLADVDEKTLVALEGVVSETDVPEEVHAFLVSRQEARVAHDFTRADELREKINRAGYTIEDTDEGPRLTKSS